MLRAGAVALVLWLAGATHAASAEGPVAHRRVIFIGEPQGTVAFTMYREGCRVLVEERDPCTSHAELASVEASVDMRAVAGVQTSRVGDRSVLILMPYPQHYARILRTPAYTAAREFAYCDGQTSLADEAPILRIVLPGLETETPLRALQDVLDGCRPWSPIRRLLGR